jgi:hypothetical protein
VSAQISNCLTRRIELVIMSALRKSTALLHEIVHPGRKSKGTKDGKEKEQPMTTPAKVASNGRNALQSTGPQTAEGKAITSRNALKHGLLSQEILLPGEDADALAELRRQLQRTCNR